ncbi:hypothetical protein H0X48_00765 [Candidatus Dependentiae bacterium]|nr:hypothetical protein [Candidatus Dependentiae bacterium]
MKKQLFIMSLVLGTTSFLKPIDVQLINNTNKALPVRLKSYDGIRTIRQAQGFAGTLAAVVLAIQPGTIIKDSLFGKNFDYSIPAHESLIIKDLLKREALYLGGSIGFFGYSNTVPLEEAQANLDRKDTYTVVADITKTAYSPVSTYIYKTSFTDAGQRYGQAGNGQNQPVSTTIGDFEPVPGYKGGTIQ